MNDVLESLLWLNLNSSGIILTLQEIESLMNEYSNDSEIEIEILRSLRNAAGTSNNIEDKKILLSHSLRSIVLKSFVSNKSLQNSKIGLQFVFNVSQGQSSEWHQEIWRDFGSVFSSFLQRKDDEHDDGLSDVVSSLFFLQIKENEFFKLEPIHFSSLIQKLSQNSQWALLALKAFLTSTHSHYFAEVYNSLNQLEYKMGILELISLQKCQTDFISESFKRLSSQIIRDLNQNKNWSSDEALEFVKFLEILCEISSSEQLFSLSKDKSLLIETLTLLKMIHLIGKNEESSEFKPLRKLSEMKDWTNVNHPVFGFKRDLIRLLGNLVWNHFENQNTVREMDGISLLLDCCSMDGKNPFIMQWVIFAIRNLTFQNSQNQEFIQNLEKTGKLDRKLLSESGIILTNTDTKKNS